MKLGCLPDRNRAYFGPTCSWHGVAAPQGSRRRRSNDQSRSSHADPRWFGRVAAEYAPAAARDRYGMFTQMGVGSGLVMSSRLFLIVNSTIGETGRAFMDWGWRQPFLFSAVLIIIALCVRLNVAEKHISE